MNLLFINIHQLLQIREPSIKKVSGVEMKELPKIDNAFLYVEDDIISDFGEMFQLKDILKHKADKVIDCKGRFILPTWYDSHTHLVYAGNREKEFVDRINGLSYEEIANRGGGILNSAKLLQETSEDELYINASQRLDELIQLGTGGIEIKSGYGLTKEAELKMLRVIRRLKENYNLPIKATFLGAHALPIEYKENKAGFMKLLIEDMLPEIVAENLADYIDIFCEKGYFTVKDTEQLLSAGLKYGLKPKIHVNQFNAIGGVQVGVKYNALSVDHLEVMRPKDIEILKNTDTIPVVLPSCSYFIGIPYAPAREMIDAGLPLALASDLNPGTTPSGNMNFVVATACIKMKITPEEAINGATINGAYAMDLSDNYGSITKGKKANFILTKKIPSYAFIPYAFGSNHIYKVYISGEEIQRNNEN